MKLDKEFKRKWVEALRSGKYKQAKGYLYRPNIDGYCCLGVVCAINGIDKKQLTLNRFMLNHDAQDFVIPKAIEKANKIQGDSWQYDLTDLNDSGRSFEEIADYIEKNL